MRFLKLIFNFSISEINIKNNFQCSFKYDNCICNSGDLTKQADKKNKIILYFRDCFCAWFLLKELHSFFFSKESEVLFYHKSSYVYHIELNSLFPAVLSLLFNIKK